MVTSLKTPPGKKVVARASLVESCCTAACTVSAQVLCTGSAQAPPKPYALNPKPYTPQALNGYVFWPRGLRALLEFLHGFSHDSFDFCMVLA